MKQKRYAKLTAAEDRRWQSYFEWFSNNHVDNRPSRADAYAWKMLCFDFPRLNDYDGALP